MHTLGQDSAVGLLLFDEPSAALDPVAEHGTLPSSPQRLHQLMICGAQTQNFSRDCTNHGRRGQWSSQLTASET
jgi:ABC-type polar amino acid transport system ATPase subunit